MYNAYDSWCYSNNVGYSDGPIIGLYCYMRWWLFILRVIWSKDLLMFSYLVTCLYGVMGLHMIIELVGFGRWSSVSVLYVMFIWSIEYEILIRLYENISLIMIVFHVDGIHNMYIIYGMCI